MQQQYSGLGHSGVRAAGSQSWKQALFAVLALVVVLSSALLFLQNADQPKGNNLQKTTPPTPTTTTRAPTSPPPPRKRENTPTLWDAIKQQKTWRTSPNLHPKMAFIQTIIPESISFSLALDQVAERYGIKTCGVSENENRERDYTPAGSKCQTDLGEDVRGDLWFHGGYRHAWMDECMLPSGESEASSTTRFVTLLQNPVEQTLRRELDQIANPFYSHYSAYNCTSSSSSSTLARHHLVEEPYSAEHTGQLIEDIQYCVDRELRYNLSLVTLAHVIETTVLGQGEDKENVAVDLSTEWIIGGGGGGGVDASSSSNADELFSLLQSGYYHLVGVQEHFNQFLVLVALTNGWALDTMYHVQCKPYERDITLVEFRQHFPDLADRLEQSVAPQMRAWQWAKLEFERGVELLGQEFQDQVAEFERGLQVYRAGQVKPFPLSWDVQRYSDKESDVC